MKTVWPAYLSLLIWPLACAELQNLGPDGMSRRPAAVAPAEPDIAAQPQAEAPSASAPPAAAALTARMRIDAWKQKLPRDWAVVGEVTVGAFAYAAAAENGSAGGGEVKAIIATDRGESEAGLSGDQGQIRLGELVDAGDLDGDGQGDVALETDGMAAGLQVFLAKADGPLNAWQTAGAVRCTRASHKGKPALEEVFIDTSPEGGNNAHFVVFWNGTDFSREEMPTPRKVGAGAARPKQRKP